MYGHLDVGQSRGLDGIRTFDRRSYGHGGGPYEVRRRLACGARGHVGRKNNAASAYWPCLGIIHIGLEKSIYTVEMASSSATQDANPDLRTIMSVVQDFAAHDALAERVHPLHPYSSDPEISISMLRDLIDATSNISASLNAQVTLPLSNPKLLSLFKQQTSLSYTVRATDQMVRQTADLLRKRVGIIYGENIPLERSMLIDWFVSRLETWGKSAGMEAFREDGVEGRLTVTLGGKIVVVDINLRVDRPETDDSTINLTGVKTSYAVPNGSTSSTIAGSISLDGFLTDSIRAFLREMQKEEELQDPEEAVRISRRICDDLKYLMALDQLALREGDQGLRWFNSMDLLAVQAEAVATKEARSVAQSVGSTEAPLDIFLMRAHALPLPYVTIPSVSFLVYLSPFAYLILLRTRPQNLSPLTNLSLPVLDMSFQHLRTRIATHPQAAGVTLATLMLATEGPALPSQSSTMNVEVLATRPTFILLEGDANVDFMFPLPLESPASSGKLHRWFLDFTDGGKYPGVVMSQSKMREIETIVNPLGAGFDHVDSMPPMAFGSGSWVDLLLAPNAQLTSERYTSLYTSPSGVHPPLQLRLAAPEEPGFFLEKIPVRNLKEVWGILEVVREQCWLNEILCSTEWIPDELREVAQSDNTDEDEATEQELQAVLEGTIY
ncbi:hypothetical protein NM688_g9223 [Phlebia brevispora]|uniref:Uncharacterized protein n=1 Tax=Phlebia brevispora TaxID=194682 RepID=A0ACC1RIN9_9APHY|nr:hypothetical protein NM688_g9223 [Phlebia brevispora]